jgi:hypothetical protein
MRYVKSGTGDVLEVPAKLVKFGSSVIVPAEVSVNTPIWSEQFVPPGHAGVPLGPIEIAVPVPPVPAVGEVVPTEAESCGEAWSTPDQAPTMTAFADVLAEVAV